ncbi:MAG: MFS transporter [Promethearchaeota archaeon]
MINSKSSSIEKKDYLFIIWLLIINTCWIFGTKISEMLLDLMVELKFEEIQIAESFFSYTIALTIFIWGYLVDKFNTKRKIILLISSFFWIIASFLLFSIEINFFIFTLIQVLWGLSFGANGPLLASYLGDLFKIERRGYLFSIFTIFIYIIKGSNIAINGIIGELLGNWKFPSFLFGLIGLIMVILYVILAEEPKIGSKEPEFLEISDINYSYRLKVKDIKIILQKRSNLLFLLQGISGMIGVTIVTKYLNYWFTSNQYDGLNINTGVTILLLGSGGVIGGLLGIIFGGKWIDSQFKKGKVKNTLYFSITCLFLQVFMYILLTLGISYPLTLNSSINQLDVFLKTYPIFFLFIILFNFAVFFGTPIGLTVGVSRTNINLPEHRGTAGALYDLTDFIGAGLGILIGTLIMIEFNKFQLTILIGSLFWIISAFLWIVITFFIERDYHSIRNVLKKRASSITNA